MNWVDYLLLGLLAVSMVISLFRGFVREVMALVVWIAAFWVAFTFSDDAQQWLTGRIELPSARMAVAYACLFLVTLIVGGMINYLLGQLIEQTGLSGTDRFIGLFFGAARGLVLIIAAVLFAGLTPLPRDQWWHESTLLPHFERLSLWAVTLLPDNVQTYFDFSPQSDQDSPDQAAPEQTAPPAIEGQTNLASQAYPL